MEKIDHFEIIEHLGSGAMGDVYKAKDTKLGRMVAIKMLNKVHSCQEDTINRFIQEAGILANLKHQNIAQIYDRGLFEGEHYMVMEFLPGETLAKYIRAKSKLSWQEAVHFSIEALKGLAHAHSYEQVIIHRDLKPSNIMVNGKKLTLLDFGIAKILKADGMGTKGSIGTPAYMAPEQIQNRMVDPRTDIYAIGTVLYEMLTGEAPYKADSEQALLFIIVQDKPKRLCNLDSKIPKSLEKIVLKALEKKPENRFSDAQAFIDDLVECCTKLEAQEKLADKKKPFLDRFFPQPKAQVKPVEIQKSNSAQNGDETVLIPGNQPDIFNKPPIPEPTPEPIKPHEQVPQSSLKAEKTRVEIIPSDDNSLLHSLIDLLKGNAKAITIIVFAGVAVFVAIILTQPRIPKTDPNPQSKESASNKGEGNKLNSSGEKGVILPLEKQPEQPPKTWQDIINQPVTSLPQKIPPEDLATLKNAADKSIVETQFYLAQMYDLGKGASKDEQQAHNGYLNAARQNHKAAQILLGKRYLNGKWVPQNNQEAQPWLEAVAQQGNAADQYALAHCYLEGKIISKDAKKARYWFERAANQGTANAQYNVGVMAEAGIGGDKDTNKAKESFEKASKQGYAKAQVSLAVLICTPQCSTLKAHKQAFDLLKQAAGKKNPQALHNLSKYYQVGIPGLVHKDIQQARKLEQQAKDIEAALTKTAKTNNE